METIKHTPTNYPSDLTDTQWEAIKEFFPQGPNSEHSKRALVNAVLYLLDNGIKWRAMPHEYPCWSTVHSFYFRARKSGLWEKAQKALVEKTRLGDGRAASPSYAIIDSQSVKTIYDSEKRGIDGGKKNQGAQETHNG